jgi:putative flavoprotein involved in K+ transport
VTPNWMSSFPGWAYDGGDADGFMGRDEIAARVARYAEVIGAPVALGTEVERLAPEAVGGFRVATNRGELSARQVVVATGSYHRPRLPAWAQSISGRVAQLHSHDYRNQAALPEGAVVVVGSGQTGLQLAEELFEAGRRVYIAVGSAGRVPRRYRGRDIFAWLTEIIRHGAEKGVTLPTADQLPDPRRRFNPMPALTGRNGGHDTNLRQYAADGMRLAGHLTGADGELLSFAGDLTESLEHADGFFEERFRGVIDSYIERAAIEAPPADHVAVDHQPEELTELNLRKAGISTLIWATGYDLGFGWIDAPILDELGYPRNVRGASTVPGLYFLGLVWQHSQASASLIGPELEGPHLVEVMGREAAGRPRSVTVKQASDGLASPAFKQPDMTTTIVDDFFTALGSGNDEAALELVTPDATFEAQGPPGVPIYGRFEGREGVRCFIATLRELFDTERFDVRQSTQSDGLAFAYGYMQHRLRSTGRVFRSEWALYCEVREGRIRTYKMFEDTAALAAAYD